MEARKLPGRFSPPAVHAFDMGAWRPTLEIKQKPLERRVVSFGDGVHAAIRFVAHPPAQAQLPGSLLRRCAEIDPLHAAAYSGFQAFQYIILVICTRRRNAPAR
jgi:hypothetical protein